MPASDFLLIDTNFVCLTDKIKQPTFDKIFISCNSLLLFLYNG